MSTLHIAAQFSSKEKEDCAELTWIVFRKAGSAHLCFPVIHAIARAFVDWNGVCGVHQAVRVCLKTTRRIMQEGTFDRVSHKQHLSVGSISCV